MSNFVSLNYVEEYNLLDITEKLKAAFLSLGADRAFRPKMKVLIKVNLPCAATPNSAQTTHPAVVRALVDVLNSYGVKCILADSPMKDAKNLDKVYFETGMLDVANSSNCELNRDLSACEVDVPNGVAIKNIYLLNLLNDIDAIVNIGKVKIDENLGFLGATSNLFGLVAGEYKDLVLNRLATIKDFNNVLIDLFETLQSKLVLNILDGVVAMEANQTPRVLSCLAVSTNIFALDACLTDVLGIAKENTIVLDAELRGYAKLEHAYKLIGEEIEKFKVDDFTVGAFTRESQIHKNKRSQQAYFNAHQKRVAIKPSKCKGCSVCSKVCPTNAIMMKYDKNGELFAEIDYSKCIFCFRCKDVCPYQVVDVKTPFGYKLLMNSLTLADKENKQ